MSATEQALIVAGIAAGATIGAALIAAIAASFATIRGRRRVLYGEAYKAALGWTEMLYRVRRRSGADDAAIIERFHDLQESLTFHEGWIASESKFVARSYRRLVQSVKTATEPLIRQAWNEDVRLSPGNATTADAHPTFDAEADSFLKDVRGHLSMWQFRKIAVYWRNKEDS